MSTQCYAMVRGSGIRITGLGSRGQVPNPIRFATSKAVAKITINETVVTGSNEFLNGDEDDDRRLHLVQPDQTINYTVDVDFLRVDPGVLSLMAGETLLFQSTEGFGEMAFGEGSFGGGLTAESVVVGFDSATRRPAVSFALEVWTRLAGQDCIDGQRQWGYTLFPFLKGGHLTGFEFKNGLVSFNLRKAMARRVPRWGVGPYDLEGVEERLLKPVSRNTLFRQMLTTAVPPAQGNGVQETTDVIDGGTAAVTSSDIIDGETAGFTSPWIVDGGRAL